MEEEINLSDPSEIKQIEVNVVRGQAYVWNPEDVLTLRRLHLVGTLIGSLPRKPWQNSVSSLPLLLLPEEVTVLKQLNKLCLSKSSIHSLSPSKEQRDSTVEHIQGLCKAQVRTFVHIRNKRQQSFSSKHDSIASDVSELCTFAGSSLDEDSINVPGDNTREIESFDVNCSEANISSECSQGSCSCPRANDVVIEEDKHYYRNATWTLIPTSHNLISDKISVTWSFPSLLRDKLKFMVFYDLWKRGYFITTAEKFGADYLVYPENPMRFHSFYIVHVILKDSSCKFRNLVTNARLGSSVKKTVVYATVDPENNFEVHYNSLAWAGFN